MKSLTVDPTRIKNALARAIENARANRHMGRNKFESEAADHFQLNIDERRVYWEKLSNADTWKTEPARG